MKKFLLLVMPMLITGCINIDYTGRKFTPEENVIYSTSASDVNMGEYTLIGRFTVHSKLRCHPYEVEDAVLEKSREFGGDILLLTDVKVVNHGVYTPNEREFGAPAPAERKISTEEAARFGKPAPLASRRNNVKRREFHYLLYKKTAEVRRQLGY